MVKARKYVVNKDFEGFPKREDFEIVEYELSPLKNGEILVKVEWVGVDPYLRVHKPHAAPYDQFGFQVGVVEQSKDPRYPVGTRVVSHKGWCDYVIIDTNNPYADTDGFKQLYIVPDLKGFSNSLAIGAVGMAGASGYIGFLEVCQLKAGETVVVTGAAGADTEDLFNFIPMNQQAQQTTSQKTLGLTRKRSKTDQTFYQYIKKPVTRGTKIIKIEIYDADSYQKSEQHMCNCEAEVCVQHVVKTILYDDIYTSTRELIGKIQDDIEPKV